MSTPSSKGVRFVKHGFLIACAVFAAPLAASAEEIVDPGGYYNPWATRQVGEWVDLEYKIEGKISSVERFKTTLLEKTADSVVLKGETTRDGKTVTKQSSRLLGAFEATTHFWKETGKEEVELDGKTYLCRVLEVERLPEGESQKSWRTLVGGKDTEVKRVSSVSGQDGSLRRRTRRVLKFSEVLTIAGKAVDCVVTEVVDEVLEGETEFVKTETTWWSDKIPTGSARSISRIKNGGTENTETVTVIDFGMAKKE